MIINFKFLNQIDSDSNNLFFEVSKERLTRRNSKKLKKKHIIRDVKKFCSNNMVDEWNKLNEEIVNGENRSCWIAKKV